MTLIARAEPIAGDRDGGASELLTAVLPLLADAIAEGADAVDAIVRIVCPGQPAMASLWNACAAAVAERSQPGRFARVRAEMERAPRALVRAAAAALRDVVEGSDDATLLTLSFSGSVAQTLSEVARSHRVRVICGEGRPRYEGRRMAETLARAGAAAVVTTDAALTVYLAEAIAVIVGADALAADHWINKVGTVGVAAAAALRGVPLYVVASRDKALARPLAAWPLAPADEVWDRPPAGVVCANPYFEAIPAELATLFLTDAGPVSPVDLPQLSQRYGGDTRELMSLL